jgi:hypothetical protein
MGPRRPCVAIDRTETQMNRSSYLVYICQAVKNRTGLERYWQVARYPENIDVLAGYCSTRTRRSASRELC